MTAHDELLRSTSAMNFKRHSKFSAKLDFEQRCEVLALYRLGVPRIILAEAYGLDRRTVTHIYNRTSVHYKAIREEETRLGQEEFIRTYLTEHGHNKVKALLAAAPDPKTKGNRTARKRAGVHVVNNNGLSKPHRIFIEWREVGIDNVGAGWYYRDLDGAVPEQWLHNGDESRMTSQTCLDAAKENIVEI